MYLLILALLICFSVKWIYSRHWNTIPGPVGLPLLGNLLSIDRHQPHRTYLAWRERYGRMFSARVATNRLVCLSDPELIRQAFSKSVAVDRVSMPLFKMFLGDKGVIFSSGETWLNNRRFTLFQLKNFGMGKSKIDQCITRQVEAFVNEVLMESCNQAVSVDKSLNIAIVNILWELISSEKFSLNDSRITDCMNRFNGFSEQFGTFFALCVMLPQSIPVWKFLPSCKHAENYFRSILKDLFYGTIQTHEEAIKNKSEPDDYIDAFLLEQDKNPEHFSRDNLMRTLTDLFIAGNDTTSAAIRWAFCFMCTFPETQLKMQEEIDRAVGSSAMVSYADRKEMPYTEAFIMETLRFGDIAPMGVEHVATCDFELNGHLIRKRTQIVSLLRAVHHDSEYFPQPERFLPERFLDQDGQIKQIKEFMPFSLGKRACLGEALARAEIFIFLVTVLQKFDLRFPKGFRHDFTYKQGRVLIREPNDFEIVPTLRSTNDQ